MDAVWPLATYGFLLGWSVAWPPGPINAEMIRRGLTRGFWAAFGLGLGACSGDAIWAVAVVLGAGVLLSGPTLHIVLSGVSTALLFILAAVFLRGAWRGIAAWRRGVLAVGPRGVDGGRRGYALGLGLALSSPWNIAFWLAVIGRAETMEHGLGASLTIAAAVIFGAATWCLILCSAVVLLRLRFASNAWEVVAKGATGLLMLYFALDGLWRLAGGSPDAVMLPY